MTTFLYNKADNCPAMEHEMDDVRILTNDVYLPWETGSRLWIAGDECGACGACWAGSEQEAWDILCDEGLLDGLACDEPKEGEDDHYITRLGNYGNPHDLTHAWITLADLDPVRDVKLLCRFAEARGVRGCCTLAGI